MAPKKRTFGNVRKLPSGRFQARYTAPDRSVITAPTTFASSRHADQWLATEQADLTRGTWRDPNAGSETLSEYLRSWIADHSNLRPRTRELYWSLADRLIIGGDEAAIPRSRSLGDHPLREITPAMVRQCTRGSRTCPGTTRWPSRRLPPSEASGGTVPSGRGR